MHHRRHGGLLKRDAEIVDGDRRQHEAVSVRPLAAHSRQVVGIIFVSRDGDARGGERDSSQLDVANQRARAEGHAKGISRRERLGRRVDGRQLHTSQLRRERQNVVRERSGSHVDSVGRANDRDDAAQDERPDWCRVHRRERKQQHPGGCDHDDACLPHLSVRRGYHWPACRHNMR